MNRPKFRDLCLLTVVVVIVWVLLEIVKGAL